MPCLFSCLSFFFCLFLLSDCFFWSSYEYEYRDGNKYRVSSQPFGRQTVTCESLNGRSVFCPTGRPGHVQLDQQLSDAPCRKDDTWGQDQDGGGIWVDRGCRAVFLVER